MLARLTVLCSTHPMKILALMTCALASLPLFHPPLFFESFLYLIFFWISLSTSWTILGGFSGYVSFGHGAFYGIGVYTMANFGSRLSFAPSLLLAGLLAAAIGLGIGSVTFRVRRLRGELFALLTLSLAIVISTIVLNTPIDGGPGVMVSGVAIPHIYENQSSTVYLMGLCVAVGSIVVAWVIQAAPLGRGLFAISDDEDVAEVLGVPTFSYKLIAISISSFLAGMMGAVHAIFVSYVTVGETFSISVPLYVLLMSILGGARHWLGPTLGAILITTISYSFVGGESALVARAAIGLTLVIATIFLPEGLIGLCQRLFKGSTKPSTPKIATSAIISAPAQIPAQPAGQPLLEARDISMSFRGLRALDSVNLTINSGEILGLVGPNGSGKSTLINVITGFYNPTGGALFLDSRDITRSSGHDRARMGIARTFQIPRPFARESVLENIMTPAQFGAHYKSRGDAEARAIQAIEFVGLKDRIHALPGELNLHQRKFLELARVLASGSNLIMLDEVLAGLTPKEISEAIEMVGKIHAMGKTILFVEHNIRAVLELSDRLIVLNQGQIVANGYPQEVMSDPAVVTAYLGADHADN